MTTSVVVVDFSQEPEFPKKPCGGSPKVELVREQVASYVDGYRLAKNALPNRIVVNANDLKHCTRRILSRMQRPHREKAKAEWQQRRKAGAQEKWRDVRPEPLSAGGLTWNGTPSKAPVIPVTAQSTKPELEFPCFSET